MIRTASQVERIERCPASAALPTVRETNEWSEVGDEKHAIMKRVIDICGEGVTVGDAVTAALSEAPPAIAEAMADLPWDILPVGKGFAAEVAMAIDLETGEARELGRGLSREVVYRDLKPTEFGGVADIIGLADDHVLVPDWKFGWTEHARARENRQLLTLALMACKIWKKPKAKVSIVRLPERGNPWIDTAELGQFELGLHLANLRKIRDRVEYEIRASAEGVVKTNPGQWCRFCPSFAACPSQTAMIRAAAGGTLDARIDSMLPLSDETFGAAWRASAILAMAHKKLKSALHTYIAYKKGEPIAIGNGLEVLEVITQGRDSIVDGELVYQYLKEEFGVELANEVCGHSATKGAIEDGVKRFAADRGTTKKAIANDTIEALRRLGAVKKKPGKKIEERKITDA